jgi:hypothetical protein
MASQMIDRLRIDEIISYSAPTRILRATLVCRGELLLGERKMFFVGDRSVTTTVRVCVCVTVRRVHFAERPATKHTAVRVVDVRFSRRGV